MGKLTEAQAKVLTYAAAGYVIYGPHGDGMGGNRWGWSGKSPSDCRRPAPSTCDALSRMGMIERVQQKYPLGYYAITAAGRTALSAAKPTQKDEDNAHD